MSTRGLRAALDGPRAGVPARVLAALSAFASRESQRTEIPLRERARWLGLAGLLDNLEAPRVRPARGARPGPGTGAGCGGSGGARG